MRKGIDKRVVLWYNKYAEEKRSGQPQQPQKERKTMTTTTFQCVTYIADGKRISAIETCATKEEAIARAQAWRKVGTKAVAQALMMDMESYVYWTIDLEH